ncbi:MAG: hypothetical protein ACHQUC_01340 [Chlamydiales bacterium]
MSVQKAEHVFTCDICGKIDSALVYPKDWKKIGLVECIGGDFDELSRRLEGQYDVCHKCFYGENFYNGLKTNTPNLDLVVKAFERKEKQ